MIIIDLNAKTCMAQLLLQPTFDTFSCIEAEITTYNTFHVDGHIHKRFFDEGESPSYEYTPWKNLRDHCFSIIKGKRTPLNFKIILSLSPENFEEFIASEKLSYKPEDIQGLYLNFRYENQQLQCATGTSMRTFSMDKSIDGAWDHYAKAFLENLS